MDPIDYSMSFLSWDSVPNPNDTRNPGPLPWGDTVRIVLDARIRLVDESSDTFEDIYLIAPCRHEWMWRDDVLIQPHSGEYRSAWTTKRILSTSRRRTDPSVQRLSTTHERKPRVEFFLTPLARPRTLTTDSEVVAASQTTKPLVAQTEIRDAKRQRHAILEYPIKTMNYLVDRQRFQVDTGPLLWPDLTSDAPEPMDWLRMAHVVYNRFEWAEFARMAPTPVERDGKAVCYVDDYSDLLRQDVRHTLYVAG